MRIIALGCLAAAFTPVPAADDIFTQKPAVAPSVVSGEPPPPAVPPTPGDLEAQWAKRFADGPVPLWIWGQDQDTRYFLKKSIAGPVKAAKVKFSADNHVRLFLNGKQIGSCDEWENGAEADLTKSLKEGENELVAEVWNAGGPAAFVLKLAMLTDKGETKYVVSDESWTASEKKDEKGVAARKIAKYGEQPWGNVFPATPLIASGSRLPANTFQVLPGFKVEKLFTVPKNELGSWVCITADDKGRLIASDEGGKGLVRITPAKAGTNEETKVERIPAKVTAAQGLLWHKGMLYVVCNGGPGSGLYRVTSSKNDDVLDKVEKLKALQGGGEHGPHAVRLAPDGQSLYVICGNHTKPPADFAHSRLPNNWGEDLLLPRQWDAGGHAVGILAPGGYVAKTDFDGKSWEIFTAGYRNPYDFAFNADGEMFVYDADMEWDMGMPWYRPTRVNHATSGSELGWRSGSGKWPSYYPDSLPAMIDIGPGSPVGVEFGYGAKFPARYQKALFICDWTFGTMYAIHITPSGSTYTATKEEFLSRTPLPLTDVCINPADGAMYFTIGGRGTQSELYRVTYVGKDSTEKVNDLSPANQMRELRRKLEQAHYLGANPDTIVSFVYPHLGHPDRFVRYAARIALEHQPVKTWQEKVLSEKEPTAAINGLIALARQGDRGLQPRMLAALDRLRTARLNEPLVRDFIRAYALVFIRMGPPDKQTATVLAQRFDGLFPGPTDEVNRESAQLLVYLQSPTIVARICKELTMPSKPVPPAVMDDLIQRNRGYGGSIANMLKNAPDLQKLHYAFVLRNATVGWNMERWKIYFGFLAEARTKAGGASYQGFINNMERDAFANATDAERLAIEAAGLRKPYKPKELPKPIGPGKDWTTSDLVAMESKLKSGRDFKNGQRAFAAARCVVCHRVGGEGGATGPDLSNVAGRFGLKDLAEALVEPSKVVSDQYKASVIRTADEQSFVGKIVNEANGAYTIVTDPEDSTKVATVRKADIASLMPSNVSLMPDKLLNTLNESEVLDMLAYMLSRGDPNHPMFRK
jgi:putative heme-binding domain-containing protein